MTAEQLREATYLILAFSLLVFVYYSKSNLSSMFIGFVDVLSKVKNIRYKKGETEIEANSGSPADKFENNAQDPGKLIEDKASSAKNTLSDDNKNPILLMYTARDESNKEAFQQAYKNAKADSDSIGISMPTIDSIYHYNNYTTFSDNESLLKLEQFCATPDYPFEYAIWLSYAYAFTKDYAKSEKLLREIYPRAIATDEPKPISALADVRLHYDDKNGAVELLEKAILENNSNSFRSVLLAKLAEIEDDRKNSQCSTMAYELALELSSTDADTRFSAAFAQSEHGFNNLSLKNYIILSRSAPNDSTALNNLGAQYTYFNLKEKGVEAYYKSKELKNTLAMANVAYLFIESGMYDKAIEVLEEAKSHDNPHKNISSAILEINRRREVEKSKLNEIEKSYNSEQKAYREAGRAAYLTEFSPDQINLKGWITSQNENVEVIRTNNSLRFEWNNTTHDYKMRASFKGGALLCDYTAKRNSKEVRTLLASLTDEQETRTGIGYLTNEGKEIVFKLYNKDHTINIYMQQNQA